MSTSYFEKSPIILASQGRYNLIDFNKLTEGDITEFDDKGFTLLHYIARDSMWDHLPINLKDKKYWQESENGDTLYMSAYYGTSQIWIHKEDLTEAAIIKRNKSGDFIALLAARNNTLHLLPKSIITNNVLRQEIITYTHENNNQNNEKLIHRIAKLGKIHAIPTLPLTEELLSLTGDGLETPYHILARNDQAKYIPIELWTKKALSLSTHTGVTPLHSLAQHNPQLIPEDIDLASLIKPTAIGETALHRWAKGNGWEDIPEKFLTKETLDLPGAYNTTPLELIIQHYKFNWLGRTMLAKMSRIISKSSDATLKMLRNNPSNGSIIDTLARKEFSKRGIIKTINKKEKCIEI